ncbi:MAG TPA: glycosyltransferase family 39 protein [Kofleriaceae bacterium]|nr:glycosyltransferase family 39 protein [Kofleriaceae bacterium]
MAEPTADLADPADPAALADTDAGAPLAPATRPARPPRAFEVVVVALLALALLLPGIWRYSLVDPWETHYGEVARRMKQDHDWVHLNWQNEGFRSKPVLTFWLMAATYTALGIADDGGYSGEMVSSDKVMLAVRLPFVLLGVMGLTVLWWGLARLVNRRVAWLGFLVLGTCPFYFLVARQGITDMILVSLLIAGLIMFLLAAEDGAEPARPLGRVPLGPGLGHLVEALFPDHVGVGAPRRLGPITLWRRRWIAWDVRWPLAIIIGGFLVVQAWYYLVYFQVQKFPTIRGGLPQPGWFLFGGMSLAVLYIFTPRVFVYVRALFIWPFVGSWSRAVRLGEPGLPSYLLGLIMLGWYPSWPEAHARARQVSDLKPLRARRGAVYALWFWALIGISVIGKGLPGFGIAGVVCALVILFQNRWRQLVDGVFEVQRGIVMTLVTVLPWHIAMWERDGRKFISEWIYFHNLNRAGVGVPGDRGTFDYVLGQAGYGMFLWAALVPLALAAAALVKPVHGRAGRTRFLVAVWAIVATALFSMSQTKFHHYILPAVPAFAILIAFWLDDLLAGRIRPSLVYGGFAAAMVLLLARDLMFEPDRWIEMFTYRHDRPWPSMPPWSIDPSDAFLVMGLCGAAAMVLLGTRLRRFAVASLAVTAIGSALWSMHVYMPIAGTHWGMREAVRTYYEQRQIYGEKVVYYVPHDFRDDWLRLRTHWDFDTFIPLDYQDGQPMAVTVEVQGGSHDLKLTVHGTSREVGPHTIRIQFDPIDLAQAWRTAEASGSDTRRGRRPTRVVDADRLIAWQLYWRGENFWSGDEIWGVLPEMQTALKETDNVAVKRYLADRAIAPEGRRYFIVTEAGRTGSISSIVPTDTARQTIKVLDTTSNKFSLAVFQL